MIKEIEQLKLEFLLEKMSNTDEKKLSKEMSVLKNELTTHTNIELDKPSLGYKTEALESLIKLNGYQKALDSIAISDDNFVFDMESGGILGAGKNKN